MSVLLKAIDDCFEHLGVEAIYQGNIVRVLKFCADTHYELADNHMVVGLLRFEVRIKECSRPLPGEQIIINDLTYTIHAEPIRNADRQTWYLEALQST